MALPEIPDWAPIAFIFVVWPIMLLIVAVVVYVTFIS